MKKLAALMIFGLLVTFLVFAQAPKEKTESPGVKAEETKAGSEEKTDQPATGLDKMTAADVEAFLDGVVPQQLATNDIAGATISVVKDGKLLFEKGYGYADVKEKKPVIADKTMFRPGSISKLFTWTAVMQLVEQGKLDLNKDVNEYLDFKIPEAFGKPITLKDILTHTPGFEEQIKDLFTYGKEAFTLEDYVKTHIPRRIFPPGTNPAYSNYATTLAGYIVQRVSGQPFNDYIEQHIFKPLEMNHSTFRQPLPANLAPDMSKGYMLGSDEAKDFEVVNAYPAGSLSSTADDMSRFMIAHLQNGQFGDAQILKPETAKLMHSRLFALDDAANGMAHGFYEQTANGHRIIGHGGDTVYFHSNMLIIPDSNVGLFISVNSAGRNQSPIREVVWDSFLDRYFPYKPEETKTLATAKEDAAAVSGSYYGSRRSDGSLFRLLAILGETTVSANEDGTISVSMFQGLNGKPKKFREVAPMRFQDVNGQDTVIFKPDADGNLRMIIGYPFMTFTRIGLWQNAAVMLPVVGISLGIMLLTLILWPIGWFVRRHYGGKLENRGLDRWLRIGVRLVFAIDLIFLSALVYLAISAMTNLEMLSDAGNKWFYMAQAIGVIGVLGTLLVIFNAVRTWMNKDRGIWLKLQSTIFVLVCLGFLWIVFAGNLLSFTSTY
ncbi:MAG: beta-lactamase family protein [Acidobacteria bacterium]|nr:beta-lactamase family protein [Acidobacteriota bacterium]